ncbi:MAG: hypothetical protein GY786_23995 [Proteobacteria bacterium]|nr:hypothetical protein [Pseudomonadota bacterium]
MSKIWKSSTIIILLVALNLMLFVACQGDDDDFNPTASSSIVSLSDVTGDATFIQGYKDAGYTAFRNTCAAITSGYAESYLFIKKDIDGSNDYNAVQMNLTKSSCDSSVTHSLVIQENTFNIDLNDDTSTDHYKPSSAAVGKGMNLYVTDVKITPNSPAIVATFKAVSNATSYSYVAYLASSAVGTSASIPTSYTSYSSTGFCGTTDWAVGVTKDVALPGDGTNDAQNSIDVGLLSESGLTDCAIPPRGDKSFYFDIGGDGSSFGGSATNGITGADGTADILGEIYLKAGIAFSSDVSADDANTIWLSSTQSNLGVKAFPTSLFGSVTGAIDNIFNGMNYSTSAEAGFWGSKNEDYPYDYVTTGSGAYYKVD